MEDRLAKEAVRDRIEDYLRGKGIRTERHFRCLNPAHEDRHPSMHYDARRKKVHCFACGADYDMFDLIGIEFGLSRPADIFKRAYAYFSLDAPGQKEKNTAQGNPPILKETKDFAAYYNTAAAALETAETALAYLARRGISLETAQRFQLGFDPAWRSPTALRAGRNPPAAPRLIIPTSAESYVARAIDGSVPPRYAKMKEGSARPLNLSALHEAGPVFIVEGEMDALSFAEIGQPAVSLGSVASVAAFLSLLDIDRPRARLLLCLDADEAGRKGQSLLAQGLAARGLPHAPCDLPEGAGDPNEALVKDRDAFAQAARSAARQDGASKALYRKSSAAYHLPAFMDGVLRGVDTPAISTGFAQLDQLLDGGLYEGLYILGAISSLGKTTLALQMADQIAAQGEDVLIFSLEMARSELMAKSISRETFRACLQGGLSPQLAKTARGITTGKRYAGYSDAERGLIAQAVDAYDAYAGHIYIHEGVGDIGAMDIRQVIAQHLALLEKKPVVIVDYLQIVAPHNERATDKQNTDKAVLELKRISRDHKLPVIGISSFNRAGYATRVQMESFKESGAIEYSSDVLLGLQCRGAGEPSFDVAAAKARDPREIELHVLKNRNGRIGAPLPFLYYPMFNYFEEARPTAWAVV